MLIGLDKQIIKPTVVGIDYEKLKECNNTIVSTEGVTVPINDYKVNMDRYIHHINITDGIMFNRLTIGVAKAEIGNVLFCYLDISKMGADDCNLIPYTSEGFKTYADKCIKYIEERYGVRLNNNKYKGESMEMNVTIEIDNKFNDYSYLLNIMGSLAIGGRRRYKYELYKDTLNECTGIRLYSKSRTKKVYDKSKQLRTEKEVKIKLDKEYMRIEDTLLNQCRIKETFGTVYLEDITDKEIKEYMVKSIEEDLIKPIEKHIAEGNKLLKKIAKEEKKKDIRKWKRVFLYRASSLMNKKGIPVVVDIEQLLAVLKEESPKNYSRDIKRLSKEIEELKHLHNNFTKLSEIKLKCNIID